MTNETRQSPAETVSHGGIKAERHPGPFIGPDVELARACALATIPYYGNDTPEEYQRIMAGGIWNDHIAVQTALTAIHSIRKAGARTEASSHTGDDPTSSAEWNNGCDFAMTQLCNVLGVDPNLVSWDAATETVDGDVAAVIGNILRAKFGDDWSGDRESAEQPTKSQRPKS